MNQTRYLTRKKKLPIPVEGEKLKTVRIDQRTQIMVSVTIPDDVARANFLERMGRAIKPCYIPVGTPNYPIKEEFKEIPVGDITELEAIAEAVAEETEVPEE
jgi:hypothetical protein